MASAINNEGYSGQGGMSPAPPKPKPYTSPPGYSLPGQSPVYAQVAVAGQPGAQMQVHGTVDKSQPLELTAPGAFGTAKPTATASAGSEFPLIPLLIAGLVIYLISK